MYQFASRRSTFTALLACAAFVCPASEGPKTFANSSAITPARLKTHLEFVASDLLQGRKTPSDGLDIAGMYIVSMLRQWGAKPAGENGTFYQALPLYQLRINMLKSAVSFGGSSFRFGTGLMSTNFSCDVEAGAVYAGHGWVIKNKKVDPYQGLDVKGKVVVIASGMPKGCSFADLEGKEGEDYAWPALAAKQQGAVAIVTVSSPFDMRYWDPEKAVQAGDFERASDPELAPGAALANVFVGPPVADKLFEGETVTGAQAGSGREAPETGFAFRKDKILKVKAVLDRVERPGYNVVAVVPGSDPKLKDEYVAFGAHLDHIGKSYTGDSDRIFNGADDDGSGVVAMLEIAHAMLTGKRPKRSCLFVWHVGEEEGMWGSWHFTEHPTLDLGKVVAQLNADMIGRSLTPADTKAKRVVSEPHSVFLVGATMMSSDLQKLSEDVNRRFLNMKFDYRFDDPKDPEKIFYRSDHYSYARKGIPVIFYTTGNHTDYHMPSDEVAKIDFAQLTEVSRTIYATGFALADTAKRPRVDKNLPPQPGS
ncbi:MAG: M28 family peptidase [Armatimonadetes bacterium]|nr:M28 family peptidase [Armatimonadota bacterium]